MSCTGTDGSLEHPTGRREGLRGTVEMGRNVGGKCVSERRNEFRVFSVGTGMIVHVEVCWYIVR